MSDVFHFGEFTLDLAERRLERAGEMLELSGRYLDALALLVSENGKLVSKARFMDEVWRGVPVTDEALTQCIRTLRRQLDDDAANPRFIETVPKHGYRFIAEVDPLAATNEPQEPFDWGIVVRSGLAGAAGGAIAGIAGGVFYGLAANAPPGAIGMGGISILLVLGLVATVLGIAGGAGIGLGLGASLQVPSPKGQWSVAGGMFGGLAVGALAQLVGQDGFALLFGHAPSAMTGAAEGALLGAAVGLADWLARRLALSPGRAAIAGAGITGLAGFAIPLLGKHLLGGSLALLTEDFPAARFRLDRLGALFGESGFGHITEIATATLEGAVFGMCMAGALAAFRDQWSR